MRIHPSSRNFISSRWQFVLLFVVLGTVLVTELQRSRVEPEPAVATIQIPTKRVVVAKVQLEGGKPIPKESLVLEDRPLPTLPADVATSIEEVVGKKPSGLVPATYPLAKSLIAAENVKKPEIVINPVDEKLANLRKETVGFAVNFAAPPPSRGTRVAIVLQGTKGGSVLLAEEAWIDDVDTKSGARVLLRPATALLFQEAKTLGSFSYLVIPDDGASPFESRAVKDISELTAELAKASKEEKPVAEATPTKETPPRSAGYAWVPGENIRYSVGKDGSINVLGRQGEVFPLHGTPPRDGAPDSFKGEERSGVPNSTEKLERGLGN